MQLSGLCEDGSMGHALASTTCCVLEAQPCGDMSVFLLAGQSNMAGRGVGNSLGPHPQVFAFGQHERWQAAVDPLHWDKPLKAGVGLGLAFAQELLRHAVGPVGLVPCAAGGSCIAEWAEEGALFQNAVRRCQAAVAQGGKLCGILWHQGESDCGSDCTAELYSQQLAQVLDALRANLWDVPVVMGELGHFLDPTDSRFAHFQQINSQLHSL